MVQNNDNQKQQKLDQSEKKEVFSFDNFVNILNSFNLNLDFLKMEIVSIINTYNFWKDITDVDRENIDKFNEVYLSLKKTLVDDILKKVVLDENAWTDFLAKNAKNINGDK